MRMFTRLRELTAFLRATWNLQKSDFQLAIDDLNRISESAPTYRVVLGMLAFSYINVGEWAVAKATLLRLESEVEPDEIGYQAYIEHLRAVMDNDLKRYGAAIDLYNRSTMDKFVRRHLPLFYPKVQGKPC
jgi:hypothetical protein